MKYTKKDFQIVLSDSKYTIKVRKPFWKFFKRWVPVTYQEAEHTEEKIMIFESFKDATDFIDLIAN